MKQPEPAEMTSGGRSKSSRASLRLAHASSRSTRSAHEGANTQSLGRLATLLAAADSISNKPKAKKAGKKAKHAAADTAQAAESNVIDFASILAMAAREGARALKNR